MADIFSSQPYNKFKVVTPNEYYCKECDFTMKSADEKAHTRGKKHQKRCAELRAAEEELKTSEHEKDGYNVDPESFSALPAAFSSTGCRNCGEEGHFAKECPNPRSAKNVECRKCNNKGHFARDCPNGGGSSEYRNCGQEGHFAKDCTNERVTKCRNCEKLGHMAKECPEEKDWSKVKCNNCGNFGHGAKICSEPGKIINNDFGTGGGFDSSATWAPSKDGLDSWYDSAGAEWNDEAAVNDVNDGAASAKVDEEVVPQELDTW